MQDCISGQLMTADARTAVQPSTQYPGQGDADRVCDGVTATDLSLCEVQAFSQFLS